MHQQSTSLTAGSDRADLPDFAEALGEPEAFRALLDSLDDAVYLVDLRRTIRFWNRAAERISGFPAAEVVGRRCYDDILRHVDEEGRSLCVSMCPLADAMTDGQGRHRLVWLHHKAGHRVPVQVRTAPIRDVRGAVIGGIEFFTDDSDLQRSRSVVSDLERQVLVDPLTQLRNRRYLDLALDTEIARLRRHGVTFAVVFADIDHFKRVNDVHGHEAGDRVLQIVADTLAGNVRPTDTVVRHGGEEFVLLLHDPDPAALARAVDRLRVLVARASVDLPDGSAITVTLSAGATLAAAEDDAVTLLRRADALMYESKRAGRDRLTLG